jgi:hypothetical protein
MGSKHLKIGEKEEPPKKNFCCGRMCVTVNRSPRQSSGEKKTPFPPQQRDAPGDLAPERAVSFT